MQLPRLRTPEIRAPSGDGKRPDPALGRVDLFMMMHRRHRTVREMAGQLTTEARTRPLRGWTTCRSRGERKMAATTASHPEVSPIEVYRSCHGRTAGSAGRRTAWPLRRAWSTERSSRSVPPISGGSAQAYAVSPSSWPARAGGDDRDGRRLSSQEGSTCCSGTSSPTNPAYRIDVRHAPEKEREPCEGHHPSLPVHRPGSLPGRHRRCGLPPGSATFRRAVARSFPHGHPLISAPWTGGDGRGPGRGGEETAALYGHGGELEGMVTWRSPIGVLVATAPGDVASSAAWCDLRPVASMTGAGPGHLS